MVECPTCGRDGFHSEASMKSHHTKIHDFSLPNRECNFCGKEFYDDNAHRERCDECYPMEGEKNPAYKDGKEETECETCGSNFEYYPSDKEGIYCEKCVKENNWQKGRKITGKDNPRWNGGGSSLEEAECSNCSKGIKVEKYRLKVFSNVFCNRECMGKWKSKNITGENHHHWKGGGNQNYGEGWTKARNEAFDRDRGECQVCGVEDSEYKTLEVHHKIPVDKFDESKDAHYMENLITLCKSCHRIAEYNTMEEAFKRNG